MASGDDEDDKDLTDNPFVLLALLAAEAAVEGWDFVRDRYYRTRAWLRRKRGK